MSSMPAILLRLAVLLSVLTASPIRAAWALEADELFERLSPSVWTVLIFDERGRPQGSGSAVVTAPGRLITNCHVVEKAASVAVRRENVRYGVTVEFADPDRDLCQLKAANFDAPAVTIAQASTLKVGARVFTIGSPRGLEMSLSDGLVSAMRRDEDGTLRFIQTSAPISPGSSGGGLFDDQGRLIGITTGAGRDAQNLNFAVPAQLIAEVPERARRRAEQRQAGASLRAEPQETLSGERRAGDWFEYRLADSLTGVGRTFILTVDRVLGGRIVFNSGSRIEGPAGELIEGGVRSLGELDSLTPPGGWAEIVKNGPGARSLRFSSTLPSGHPVRFDLEASFAGEQRIKLGPKEYDAVRIDLKGWTYRPAGVSGSTTPIAWPYRATVWFSTELRRVQRFSYAINTSGETLELVGLGNSR